MSLSFDMRYRQIGTSDISISEVGIGTWALGGPNFKNGHPEGWSCVDENAALDGLHYALDRGVTHFDTADVYGNGQAEQLLGKGLGDNRKRVVIGSKLGWVVGDVPHVYHPYHIQQQCEQSLANLATDYLDILYFHHDNFGPNDQYVDNAIEAMHALKKAGKIRLIGLSAHSLKSFKRLIPQISPDVIQGHANMLDYRFIARNSQLMQLCEKYGASFIGYQPIEQGILLGKYNPDFPPVFAEGDHRSLSYKFEKAFLHKAQRGLDNLSQEYGADVSERARLALQFVLAHKGVTGTVVGVRSRAQLKALLQKLDKPFNGNDLAKVYRAFQ